MTTPLMTTTWALMAAAAEGRPEDAEPLLADLSHEDVGTIAYALAHFAVRAIFGRTTPTEGQPAADAIRAVLLALAAEQEGDAHG